MKKEQQGRNKKCLQTKYLSRPKDTLYLMLINLELALSHRDFHRLLIKFFKILD
jgi:hypothetical protein